LAYLASPPTQRPIQSVYLKGNLFAAVLMSELFVVTTSLSTRVGLAWKSHVLHLAEGLGIYSIAALIVEMRKARNQNRARRRRCRRARRRASSQAWDASGGRLALSTPG
jgi:hypothetical protein